MRLEELITYFDTSPAVTLWRSSNAPFITYFLYREFKTATRITLPMSELQASLGRFQEELHETHPEVLRDHADLYLSAWCTGEHRWLLRFFEAGRDEPMYQLTSHTEGVLLQLDRAMQADPGFVGTESRLRMVTSELAKLVADASTDPEVHLRHLREERARLDEEITRVERDGVTTHDAPAKTRERFALAVSLLKDLLADFRAVEERFKTITQQVQQRESQGQDTRGSILQYALDAEDVLKQEDQGVSFYAFVRFILSPTEQERLQATITELGRLATIAPQGDGLATVRRMVPALLEEAEKVMRTNQRLSVTLRRMLAARSANDRQRLPQVLREIRGLAVALSAQAPLADVGVYLETGPAIILPLARTFWHPPSAFATLDLTAHTPDDTRRLQAFKLLGQMHRLDWRALRTQIVQAVALHDCVTLKQLVTEFPPRVGVVELLGYLQLAKDDGHLISRELVEHVMLPAHGVHGRALRVTVPMVYYTSKERSANG